MANRLAISRDREPEYLDRPVYLRGPLRPSTRTLNRQPGRVAIGAATSGGGSLQRLFSIPLLIMVFLSMAGAVLFAQPPEASESKHMRHWVLGVAHGCGGSESSGDEQHFKFRRAFGERGGRHYRGAWRVGHHWMQVFP